MSENVLKLREEVVLDNLVRVEGYLKAKSITEANNSEGQPFIRGTLTVFTGKCDVEVNFRFNKFRKDGDVNKLYESALKIKEYVSITDLLEKNQAINEESAKHLCDIVSIQGNINPNEYLNDENDLVSKPQINGIFFHRQDKASVKTEKFGVFFEIEIYFASIKPEYKNNIETGRAIIEAVVPTFVGSDTSEGIVGAMTFYVAEEVELENGDKAYPAKYILSNYSKNASGRVNGHFLVNTKEETSQTSGFGTASKVTSNSVSYEWIITGGDPRQYNSGSRRDFDQKAIQDALSRRLIKAQEYKANKQNKPTTTRQQAGFGNVGFGNYQNQNPKQNVTGNRAAQIAAQFSNDDF